MAYVMMHDIRDMTHYFIIRYAYTINKHVGELPGLPRHAAVPRARELAEQVGFARFGREAARSGGVEGETQAHCSP